MVIFWINPNIFDFFVIFFVIVFGPEKTGGPNKLGGWNMRENQINGEGGGGGNFNKIKRKGLFVNKTQFYH